MTISNCRIKKNFQRPAPEIIARFRDIPAANLDDCMNRMAALDSRIHAYSTPRILGPALTVKVPYGDNLMLHKAIDMAMPGDILVVSCEQSYQRAIFGSIIVNYLLARKLGGIIVDGAIRDSEEIASLGFPVYACCTSPNGPLKNGPGEINYPIAIGGQIVNPGDIICGDADGIVVIRPDEAECLYEKAAAVMEKEAAMIANAAKGSMPRPFIEPALERLGCTYED